MKALLSRIIVALFCIPLVLIIYWNGSYFLIFFLTVVNVLFTYEFINLLKKDNIVVNKFLYVINPLIMIVNSILGLEYSFILIFAVIVFVSSSFIIKSNIDKSIKSISFTLFLVVYTSLFLSYIYKIRELDNGPYLLIILVVLVWITDTFAYFTGVVFGKHKNIFKVSPKKSLEGFFGGFIFCFLGAVAFRFLFYDRISFLHALFAIFSAAIAGQYGDLLESLIKRSFNVKDTSAILFGHGGLLDRFDSLLIAAPVYFFLIIIFLK